MSQDEQGMLIAGRLAHHGVPHAFLNLPGGLHCGWLYAPMSVEGQIWRGAMDVFLSHIFGTPQSWRNRDLT